jgi:NAD-dependent dihydropyrimidine dehydrogenase PreA subunit
MITRVNQELCTGCGTCVDSCPVEAIRLVDQQAVIDDALCTQCEACIDACPNGAITALSIPARSSPILAPPAAETRMIPVPAQSARPEIAAPAHGLAPLAGAALTFLGSEVAPRLADVLIAALERRLTQSTPTTIAPVPASSRGHTTWGRGERRQARYRGGRTGNRNPKERR